jgi:hypothetical protein
LLLLGHELWVAGILDVSSQVTANEFPVFLHLVEGFKIFLRDPLERFDFVFHHEGCLSLLH